MQLRELLLQYESSHNLSHIEMAEEIGISLSTYYRWINGESTKLKKSRIERLSRVLECDVESVLEEEDRLKPILGKVKAGYDLWADQDVEGYIELGQADAHKGDYFLRVTGDSMVGSHIYENDLVYVQQCSQVESGNIAIVLIGEEATIKKVYYKNDLMILEASNPKYESKFYTLKEVNDIPIRIIGLVRFVRRDFV